MTSRRANDTAVSRRTSFPGSSAVAAIALSAAIVACGGGEAPSPAESVPPADVQVSSASRAAAERTVPATVEAARTAGIATRVSGTVVSVPVDVGTRVRRGDTLLEIDDRDVEARIERAEAGLRRAERYHARIQSLASDGAATEQELDDARAGLAEARAALEEARAQRSYVVMTAPFDGVVTRRSVDPGDLAAPGRPVLTLVGAGSLKVVADLPAEFAPRVEEGTGVTVVDPRTGRRAPAEIARVSPAVESATRQFRVEARFEDRGSGTLSASPGSFVRLRVPGTSPPTVWVPGDAVFRRGQLAGVFVLRSDTLRLRWVRTGDRRAGSVEILAGIAEGDRVVRSPGARLADGTPAGDVTARPWRPAPGAGDVATAPEGGGR